MRITPKELETLNERFLGKHPLEILRFVSETFGSRAAILSSMQRGGTVTCHMADRAGLQFDVLFVDTGVLHNETLWTRDEVARTHPNLRVRTLYPPKSFAEQTGEEGLLYVTREGQERCCDLRKTEPLLGVRGQYDAIISALRREQGGSRARTQTFALDTRMNALRVHPVAYLTRVDMAAYVREHPDMPLNPLHRMGFPTIGCYTCTTPVRPEEGERAGRWRHLAGVDYCGINPQDRGDTQGGVDLDDRYTALLG